MLAPSTIFSANPNVAIPNDGYNGTLASMACSTINTNVFLGNAVVARISVAPNITHTSVGDLTLKLVAPSGTVFTILNRPGSNAADTGADTPAGDNSNWAGTVTFQDGAATSAENMGSTIIDTQTICTNDGLCTYTPAPGTATTPPSTFLDLEGQLARGNWQLCAGDSNPSNTGTFVSWSLNITPATRISATPAAAMPDNGYVGGFGGAGQACSTINTTGIIPIGSLVTEAYIDVNLTHTWVGDLTIKLQSPGGTILTVLNRPGSNVADNGTDTPFGDDSNWNGSVQFRDASATTAETMGNTIADGLTICTSDGRCKYTPSPDTATQPPTNFAAFAGSTAVGNWTLCVGDSAGADTGTLNSWSLKLADALTPTAASVEVTGRLLDAYGRSVSNAVVKMADVAGNEVTARSNTFGYFRFLDIAAGNSYTLSVSSKNRIFTPRVISISDSIDDLVLVAEP